MVFAMELNTDAWVLMALAHAQGDGDQPPAYAMVIGAADAINAEILSPEEFEEACGRLASIGLVSVESGDVVVTPAGQAIVESARSHGTTKERVERALAGFPRQSGTWQVDRESFASGFDTYMTWVLKAIAESDEAKA